MKHVTQKEIERLSQESARILYGESGNEDVAHRDDTQDAVLNAQVDVTNQGQSSLQNNASSGNAAIVTTTSLSRPQENALRVMRAQSAQRYPFLLRSEAAHIAGIKGLASLLNGEKAALENDYIVKHELPRAKTKVVFWEITKHGYEVLRATKYRTKSKGRYVHKFCAYRITDVFKRKGLQADIEYRLPNGKLVDVVVHESKRVKYIEICSSYPLEKELINLERDLTGDAQPDELVFAVTQRRMKDELLTLIDRYRDSTPVACSVKVVLAGDLIARLEVES